MNAPAPAHASRRRRPLRFLFCNPVTTILLTAALVHDVLSLPNDSLSKGVSTVGATLRVDEGGNRLVNRASLQYSAFFIRVESEGLRQLPGMDEARPYFTDSPERCMWAIYKNRAAPKGFWAITHEDHGLMFGGPGAPPTLDERRQMAAVAADAFASLGDAALAQEIRSTPQPMRRYFWSGYLHNTLSLTAFLALLYSLQWIPKTPAWFRDRRRAAAHNLCPRCRYSLAGLGPGAPCPECGATPLLPDLRGHLKNDAGSEVVS